MARERMVTRTVEEKEVVAVTLNFDTNEVSTFTTKISATIPSDKVLSYIEKNVEHDKNIAFVFIKSETIHTTLYGMPEQEFISLAKVLPNRNVGA